MIYVLIAIAIIMATILTIQDIKHNKQKTKNMDNVSTLHKLLSDATKDSVSKQKRVTAIEDAVKNEYGVAIRREITNVNVDFSDVELVIMLSGVMSVLKNASNPDDINIYVELTKKIQDTLNVINKER